MGNGEQTPINKLSGRLWMMKMSLPPGRSSSRPSSPGLQDSIVYSCSQTVRESFYEGNLKHQKVLQIAKCANYSQVALKHAPSTGPLIWSKTAIAISTFVMDSAFPIAMIS